MDAARARARQERSAVDEVALIDTHESGLQRRVPILVLEAALENLERIRRRHSSSKCAISADDGGGNLRSGVLTRTCGSPRVAGGQGMVA